MIYYKFIVDLVSNETPHQIPEFQILVRFRSPDLPEAAHDASPDRHNAYFHITPHGNPSKNQIAGIDYQLRYCEQYQAI